MATLHKFLTDQFKRSGITGNADLEKILTDNKDAFDAIEIPPLAVNLFSENLMSIEQAKNNETLKAHYHGQLGGGIDSNVMDFFKANEILEPGDLEELKSIKSTGQKVSKALEKMFGKLADAKKQASKSGTVEANQKVQELELQIANLKGEYEGKISEVESRYKSKLENEWIKSNTAFDWSDAYPVETRVPVYQTLLQKELDSLGAKLVYNHETGKPEIVSATDPTLKVFPGGKELLFSDIHVATLQKNKLMKEAGAGGGNPNPSNTPSFTPPSGGGGNTPKMSPSAASSLAENMNILKEMTTQQ